jgi:long-chain fatty acid transport protein
MKKNIKLSAVASALALMAAASDSKAAAFALYEQGVSGLGNAYAGAAAAAEDASTVWWNPAGMGWLPAGKHIAFAGTWIEPSTQFSDKGSVAAAGRPLGGTGGEAGQSAVVPSMFFAMDLSPELNVGLGVGVPFGQKTEYDATWLGRFQGISSRIKTVNFNPSASYKFSPTGSVGFGLDYAIGEINLLSAVNLGPAEALNRTNVRGDGWGFNVGLLADVGQATRLGVHFRSAVKFKLEGDTAFTAPAPQTLNSKVKLDVRTPDNLAVSLAHRVNDRLQLLGDVTWWHWSKIDRLPLIRTDGPATGATLDTIVLGFKDTWRFSAGANYKLAGPWTLKLGAAYDQSPVKTPEARTVRLPDSDRYWLSAGLKYTPWKSGAFDLGYTFVKAKDGEINNDQTSVNRGIVRGTYEASVHLVGIQYQHSF